MFDIHDYFTTKPILIKRNNRKILGLYPEEKLVRKMVKAGHVVRIPEPSFTIDAETYDREVSANLDWCIVFNVDDGRRYIISVPHFNQHKVFMNRGRGDQWRIPLKRLTRIDGWTNGGSGGATDPAPLTPKPSKSSVQQISLFGGELCKNI